MEEAKELSRAVMEIASHVDIDRQVTGWMNERFDFLAR